MGQQLTLTGTLSDGTSSDVTSQATFASDDVTIATVTSPGGLVTYGSGGRVYGGSCGITSSIGGVTATSAVRAIAADSGSQLIPQRDSDWVALGLSPWGSYGGCQEGTGSLVLSGSADGTFPALGSPIYRVAVPNWTRKAVNTTDLTAQGFVTTGTVPDVTLPFAYLCYSGVAAAAGASRTLMGQTGNTTLGGRCIAAFGTNNGRFGVDCSGTLVTGVTDYRDGRVHPFLMVYDPVNSRVKAYTDLEHVTGTFSTLVNGTASPMRGFGQISTTKAAASGTFLFVAVCTGSVAGALSDDGRASAFMRTLGWGGTLNW